MALHLTGYRVLLKRIQAFLSNDIIQYAVEIGRAWWKTTTYSTGHDNFTLELKSERKMRIRWYWMSEVRKVPWPTTVCDSKMITQLASGFSTVHSTLGFVPIISQQISTHYKRTAGNPEWWMHAVGSNRLTKYCKIENTINRKDYAFGFGYTLWQ